MKKIFTLTLALLGLMSLKAASAFTVTTPEYMPLTVKMSANHKYIVGTDEANKTPMVWNTQTGEVEDLIYLDGELLSMGTLNDITNTGLAVGKLTNDDTNRSRAITTDVSKDINDFIFLAGTEEEDGSEALAISENLNIIVGYYNMTNTTSQACIWLGETRKDLPNPTEEQLGFHGENTKACWISTDASIIAGTVLNESGYPVPVIWHTTGQKGNYEVSACPSKDFIEQYAGFQPTAFSPNFEWMLLQVKVRLAPGDWDSCDMPQAARLNLTTGQLEVYGDACEWSPMLVSIANDGTAVGYTQDDRDPEGDGLPNAVIWPAGRNELVTLRSAFADDEYLSDQTAEKLCGIDPSGYYAMGYAGDEEGNQTAFLVNISKALIDPAMIGDFVISPSETETAEVSMIGIWMSNNRKFVVGTDQIVQLPLVWDVEKNVLTAIEYIEPFTGYDTESGTEVTVDDLLRGEVRHVTDEGIAIGVLESNYSSIAHAFSYNIKTQELTLFQEDGIFEGNDAYAMTEDGSMVVGFIVSSGTDLEDPFTVLPCIWTENGAKRTLLPTPTKDEIGFYVDYAEARAISADGSVIAGFAQDKLNGSWVFCYWTRNSDGTYSVQGDWTKMYYTNSYTEIQGKYITLEPSLASGGLSANGEWVVLNVQRSFDVYDFSIDEPLPQCARLNLKTGELEVMQLDEEEVTSYPSFFNIANDGTAVGRWGEYIATDAVIWRPGHDEVFSLSEMFPTDDYVMGWSESSLTYISADARFVMGQSADEDYVQTCFYVCLSEEDPKPQAIESILSDKNHPANKTLQNSQLIIIKDGVSYSIQGVKL